MKIILAYTDDDRAFETSVQIRQAQGTFPPAFSAAIFQLVEMLEDEDIIDNGAIGICPRCVMLFDIFPF
jgi:hypothetical protein